MDKRILPIGIQSFRDLRERNGYYVDKTGYALRLIREGKHYFLSRPRRFGKSLFVDTLKHLFEGDRDLFVGLEAYDQWDWSVRYPVVRLDFAGLNANRPGALEQDVLVQLTKLERTVGMRWRWLPSSLKAQLSKLGRITGAESYQVSGPRRLEELIRALRSQAGQQVCIFIDEYDKPILDAIEDPDLARANRDYLSGLYGMLKSCDQDIRFAFLTGVSKFSKVSLFSGLNNLNDITLDERYAAICGYTEDDLDTVFAAELPGLDREQIREWYNGYSWGLAADSVYNPFDLLLLFDKRAFRPWWFETGTPTFLTKLLTERCLAADRLDGLRASEALLGTFDVDRIAPEALLFQTGYLTIGGRERSDHGIGDFRLVYPNREVRESLNLSLLNYITGDPSRREEQSRVLQRLLKAGDMDGLEAWFRALFSGIPYHWHNRNAIADYEGYYASVFYSFFVGSGATVTTEDSGSMGRCDLAVQTPGRVYLFEFKVFAASQHGAALRQLQERDYAAKYRHLGLPIHLVGVEFNAQKRNVEVFEAELA